MMTFSVGKLYQLLYGSYSLQITYNIHSSVHRYVKVRALDIAPLPLEALRYGTCS